jgi:hypothetical protein
MGILTAIGGSMDAEWMAVGHYSRLSFGRVLLTNQER